MELADDPEASSSDLSSCKRLAEVFVCEKWVVIGDRFGVGANGEVRKRALQAEGAARMKDKSQEHVMHLGPTERQGAGQAIENIVTHI